MVARVVSRIVIILKEHRNGCAVPHTIFTAYRSSETAISGSLGGHWLVGQSYALEAPCSATQGSPVSLGY